MAERKKLRQTIRDLVERRTNVRFSEIDAVIRRLPEHGFSISSRQATHGVLYRVDEQRFMICTHHPGSKEVKPCYVKEFARAMMELGLYEE